MEVALFDMVALQIFTLFSTIIAMRLLRGSFALGKSFGFGIVQHTTSRTKIMAKNPMPRQESVRSLLKSLGNPQSCTSI